MASVEMYSTGSCPYCVQAKRLLDSKDIAYVEIRVDQDPEKLAEMMRRADGRRSVPQIVINDEAIGGFDDLWALEQSGELAKKLAS